MINITCKCGQTSMQFRSLSEKDFPNGWETECCQGATEPPKSASEPLVEAPAETLPELPEPDIQQLVEEVAKAVDETPPTPPSKALWERKAKGRKGAK